MSPRHHFADYMRDNPQGYQTFSDNLWNSFVTVTHKIGLSPFFSFTPEFLQAREIEQATEDNFVCCAGRYEPGEIPGDQDQTI